MRRNKQSVLILLLALASFGFACQQNVTQPPTDTQQLAEARAWAKMVDYFGIIETSRHTANQIALDLSLQNPPLVPVSMLESFVKINEWTIHANNLLQTSMDNFEKPVATQVIALAVQIIGELKTIPAPTAGPEPTPLPPVALMSAEITKMEEAAQAVKELEATWTQ